MSRAALWAHNDGECDGWTCHYCAAEEAREHPVTAHNDGECDGWTCHYCAAEEAREHPVTLTSDGIEIPLPDDPDEPEEESDQ